MPTRNERIGAYKFLKILAKWLWKNKQKIFSKKLARLKKSCTFAPANWNSGEQKKNDTFIDILNWQHKFVAIQIWKKRESKIFRLLLKRLATWIENISWFINLTTYDEEFDPGSGWTLAAGLTHASRGVEFFGTWDRRTGA